MYYRLASDLALRGWKNATGMLVKRPENEAHPLKPAEFSVLVLCDGQTPLDTALLQEAEQTALHRFIRKGIVTIHEAPTPVDESQLYRYFDNRFIQRVMWSVTGVCNFRCRHCFVDSPCETSHGLSTQEALALIDQISLSV